MKPILLASLFIAAAASASPAPTDTHDSQTLRVGPGEALQLAGPLMAVNLIVEGSILGPANQPLEIIASHVDIRPGASIVASDGISGESASGPLAVGRPGLPGQDLTIVSATIVQHAGSLLAAGSGGAGGDAASNHTAIGGDGAPGGRLVIVANSLDLAGFAAPGAGGHGGSAVVHGETDGRAIGGDGGDAGTASIWEGDKEKFPEFDNERLGELMERVGAPRQIEGPSSCFDPGTTGNPPLGDGGHGGNACVEIHGKAGEHGANGNNGWGQGDCTSGQPGNPGGPAEGHAQGGAGGNTVLGDGGDGGDAFARLVGGDGGDGGNAGQDKIGNDYCNRGGDGGDGGRSGGRAIGGDGGSSICGGPGEGGEADSAGSSGGAAGQGGQGAPDGEAGAPGSTDIFVRAGGGGQGLNVCPGPVATV